MWPSPTSTFGESSYFTISFYSERVDCHPEAGTTVENCAARGCIYDANISGVEYVLRIESVQTAPVSTPACYYPQSTGFVASDFTMNSAVLTPAPQSVPNPYEGNIPQLSISVRLACSDCFSGQASWTRRKAPHSTSELAQKDATSRQFTFRENFQHRPPTMVSKLW